MITAGVIKMVQDQENNKKIVQNLNKIFASDRNERLYKKKLTVMHDCIERKRPA